MRGAFGSGASGSSMISARLRVPLGTPDHCNGGETSSPSHVYLVGISPLLSNFGDFNDTAIAFLLGNNGGQLQTRIIRAVGGVAMPVLWRQELFFGCGFEGQSARLFDRRCE